MAKIWSLLRGKTEERLQPYEKFLNNYMNMYGDQALPLYRTVYNNQVSEELDTNFISFVNGAYKANGVIFACCMARMMIFSEAKFLYQKWNNGRPGDMYGKESLKILEEPWPNGSTGELLSRAIQDTDLSGNHYVVREEAGPDGPRLRRLRPDWVSIILSEPVEEAVASDVVAYLYRPGGSDDQNLWEYYPIDGSNGAVAHWSPIPDPTAQYRGMSWITPIIRELKMDQLATHHKTKFFENAATPNLAVSFKETVTAEQFKEFMKAMDENKAGIDHAYETLYLGGGADVTVVGSDVRQMDFKQLQGLSETRIAAAARVHPAIVGLSEGLQGSSLNEGNFRAARDGFSAGTMRPLWRSLCSAYRVLVDVPEDSRLWFDTRDIEFLRNDQKEIAEIQAIQSSTISKLVMQGYTPDSAAKYVKSEDLDDLKHTGLYSVQLQPPGTVGKGFDPASTAQLPSGGNTTKPKPGEIAKANAPKGQQAAPQKPLKTTKPAQEAKFDDLEDWEEGEL